MFLLQLMLVKRPAFLSLSLPSTTHVYQGSFLWLQSPFLSKWEWFPLEMHQPEFIPPSLCSQKRTLMSVPLHPCLLGQGVFPGGSHRRPPPQVGIVVVEIVAGEGDRVFSVEAIAYWISLLKVGSMDGNWGHGEERMAVKICGCHPVWGFRF
jgi:hypothetical protein